MGGSVFGTAVDFYMYEFDRIDQTLTQRATLPLATTFEAVDWAPDGKFLAIGTDDAGGGLDELFIYEWDRVNNQFIQKDSQSYAPYNAPVYDVKWSPDGRYLAVGASVFKQLEVYELDKDTGLITMVVSANPPNSFTYSVNWSADGRYLATASSDSAAFIIYEFDKQANTLTAVSTSNPGGNSSQVYSVAWDPVGDYIAVGSQVTPASNPMLFMYTAFDFPQNCVIKDNMVYCNSGGIQSRGVGISGSSISNLIIGNTAYSNPLNPFMVSENYQFVTTVFNSMFENAPTLLQNLSLAFNQPICIPENEAFLAQQLIAKVDDLAACSPVSLDANNVSDGTISLTLEGTYCLNEDLTTDISITATCVSLDLNDRILTGIINITGDDVQVKNGFIEPAARTSSSDPVCAVNIIDPAVGAIISDLTIACANSTGNTVNGRGGICVGGSNTFISKCNISTGAGSTSSAAGGNGGNGIELSSTVTAVNVNIQECVIYTGNGSGSTMNMPVGNGGNGYLYSACKQCKY